VLVPVWPVVGEWADSGRISRIKAGVTSDARQVTSARSADRFQGLPGFGAGLLPGVCFGLEIA